MGRSTNSTPENVASSTIGNSLLRFPVGIRAGKRPPRACAIGGSLGVPWVFLGYAPLRRLRIARSQRHRQVPSLEMLRLRPSAPHVCASPVGIPVGNPRKAHMYFLTAGVSRGFSLGMLHCEEYGSLDLGEIHQFHSGKRCVFDHRQLTVALPRGNSSRGTPASHIGTLRLLGFPVGFPWACSTAKATDR